MNSLYTFKSKLLLSIFVVVPLYYAITAAGALFAAASSFPSDDAAGHPELRLANLEKRFDKLLTKYGKLKGQIKGQVDVNSDQSENKKQETFFKGVVKKGVESYLNIVKWPARKVSTCFTPTLLVVASVGSFLLLCYFARLVGGTIQGVWHTPDHDFFLCEKPGTLGSYFDPSYCPN